MNERIKEVRKHSGQTQQAFGESLGVNRGTLASYETGRVVPSKTFLQLLCTTYKVNEEWLTTGEGPMYPETREDAIERFARENGLPYYAKKVLNCYLALGDETKEAVDEFLQGFIESCNEGEAVEVFSQAAGGGIIPLTGQATKPGANVTMEVAEEIAEAEADADLEAEADAIAEFARNEYLRGKKRVQPASSSTNSNLKGAGIG